MILQIRTDSGRIANHLDARSLQITCAAYSREHQEVRGIDGPAAQDDFPCRGYSALRTVAPNGHTDRPAPSEIDTQDHSAGHQLQVFLRQCRVQKGARAATALPILLCHLVRPDTLLVGPVEVVVQAQLEGLSCLQKSVGDRVEKSQRGNIEFPAGAMIFVCTELTVLVLLEKGQHVSVAPTAIARRSPIIIVGLMAADVDHAIHRAGAADHTAPRAWKKPALQPPPSGPPVSPIETRAIEQRRVAGRSIDTERRQQRPIGRPGLEYANAAGSVR